MRVLITLIGLSLSLSACGPSKEEILRQQMLAQQRAEIAQLEAQEQALRVQQRIQTAEQYLQDKTSVEPLDLASAKTLFNSLKGNQSYYFDVNLQADKYNYGQELQSFAIIGMRSLKSESFDNNFELILAKEEIENNFHQWVEKSDGKRISANFKDIKQPQQLLALNQNWQINAGIFNDFDWRTEPEEAWSLTSNITLNMQIELRLCNLSDCQTTHQYQEHPTTSYQAEVLSILIYRTDNRKLLGRFVSERP